MKEGKRLENKEITIEEMLQMQNVVKIDVRSQSEYMEGTIPEAINIPLLDDEERAQVGIIYKQICTEKAKSIGNDFVRPKLPNIIKQIQELSNTNKDLVLFCWRGGMRSQSLTDYCNEKGLNVSYLAGGYRAYRKLVYSFFNQIENLPEMVVLMGLTGVGKTRLLSLLAKKGVPTIDIEEMVNNRGSVFGQIHGGHQPSQKAFEATLYENISRNKLNYSVIECESKRIGKLYIPDALFKKMKNGRRIHLYASSKIRAERLVEDYASFPEDKLVESILHLKKALGNEKIDKLIDFVRRKEFGHVADILLKEYYDPLYGYPTNQTNSYDISINCDNLSGAVEEIIEFLQTTIQETNIKEGEIYGL